MPVTFLLLTLYISAFAIAAIGFSKRSSLLKALAGLLLIIAVALTIMLGVGVNNM